MNAYKPTEISQARKDFRQVFNTGLEPFLEHRAMIATIGMILIDIIVFDAWLRRRHPAEAGTGFSCNAIIKSYYGDAGLKLIDKLTLT